MEIIDTDSIESVFQSTAAQCPKFQSCNAPICPMDKHWRQARHLNGEPVCFYLRQVSKDAAQGGFDNFERPHEIPYQAATLVYQQLETLPATLRYSLQKASQSPSKTPPKKPVDPVKAEAAMLKLQKVFREEQPLSRFN